MSEHSQLLTFLGTGFRQLREDAGLSQREAAAALDTAQGRISAVENGQSDLKLSTLVRWANAYGYHLEILFHPMEDPLSAAIDELMLEGLLEVVTSEQE